MDGELDAAAETASRVIPLLEDSRKFGACQCHFIIRTIYSPKGDRKKAIEHLEATLKIASLCDWHDEAFSTRQVLAVSACQEGSMTQRLAIIRTAKQHVVSNTHTSTFAMGL